MATFMDRLLSDARWYAYSIFFTAALIVSFYLLSPAHSSVLRVLGVIVSYFVAGGMMMLLRWLKSKKPKDPGDQAGASDSLHFRAAAGKKSK